MNGIKPNLAENRLVLATIAFCLLGFRSSVADERSIESQPESTNAATIDPFIQEDKAAQTLAGIWEYSADYIAKRTPTRAPPGFLGREGEQLWPLDRQKIEKPVQSDRKMSAFMRIDLRSKHTFRAEVVLTDHSDKACGYTFGEGTWKLRGRVLVLTFLLDDEVTRWAFFVRKLADNEMAVTGIGDSQELLRDGRGVFAKTESPKSLSIPDDYSVDIDEFSFGSATVDVAQYLRERLNIEVEIPQGQ